MNILFALTLFLLFFIPLYPKLPLLDIMHTWVYIRVEDFVVLTTIILWVVLFLRKKATLKTPLTLPIMLFWIIGGLATLHGVLLIFPTSFNLFSNVAFLSFLRRIEYMSLFFIAYSGFKEIRSEKAVSWVAATLTSTLLLIVGYGFGQKFLGFPAFLTMNEEFAKGTPMRLSELSRVPSTFAGHYDLAAYLVLIIPILVSLSFGFKNSLMRILLLATSTLGFILLLMTVSRVSFFVLLFSLLILLFFQKKRAVLIFLFILVFLLLGFAPALLARFGRTVSEINVLVNAKNGAAIGEVKEVPGVYFENKIILREGATMEEIKAASSSAIFPFQLVPARAKLVVEPNSPSGENLPQGTSYINLPLSPVTEKVGTYFFQKTQDPGETKQPEIRVSFGDFVVKAAKAYDLSFTTRFQGEWPRTLLAFERNIFLGSGYGSVSLAVDNDYLRALGESGLLGFAAFLSIFIILGIHVKKLLPRVESPLTRSFILGFIAGTVGLALNAVLIDVFEASKIAFTFWLLVGITLGVLEFYKDREIDSYEEFKKLVTSPYAIIIYLFIFTFVIFSKTLSNYFVGDDFVWFRWVVDCDRCQFWEKFIGYFTQANGFFYRPGAKLYFDLMHSAFWLNQTIYHLISIILHFVVAVLVFLITRKILKNFSLSTICAFLFLVLSGYSEVVLWTSATGYLFNTVFALLSLLFFIFWKEKRKRIYLVASFIFIIFSLLFHEVGIIVPFLIILYDLVFWEKFALKKFFGKTYYSLILSPILPYLLLRLISRSHWFSGDYSYNLIKLPFNFVGNTVGYLMLSFFGAASLPFYEKLRIILRGQVIFAFLGSIIVLYFFVLGYRFLNRKLDFNEKRIVVFGSLFFLIALLPFLGLGNIASRYSYLPSFGFSLLFIFFLKKAYNYLLDSGKNIAIATITIIVLIFVSSHLFQLQKIQRDWEGAGNKTKEFLTSLDWIYAHYPREETERLFFVDVPIRNGEAWVLPVGLEDAVWLVLRDKNLKIYTAPTVTAAHEALGGVRGMVFKFDNDGSLIEMKKLQSGEIVPIKR